MGRYLVKLGTDAYVGWSTVVDAPVSSVIGFLEACMTYGAEAVWNARDARADGGMWNRSGPNESCLTPDAMIRFYNDRECTHETMARDLRPEDILPHTTQVHAPGQPDHGQVFWVPWKPGEAPDSITADTDLHAMVPVDTTTYPQGGES